jgi:hypothetical protein
MVLMAPPSLRLTLDSVSTPSCPVCFSTIFGDPQNYLLGLFGDMTVRIDESVYADKRLIAILGDAIVGGNIVAHHGFVVGSVTAQSNG